MPKLAKSPVSPDLRPETQKLFCPQSRAEWRDLIGQHKSFLPFSGLDRTAHRKPVPANLADWTIRECDSSDHLPRALRGWGVCPSEIPIRACDLPRALRGWGIACPNSTFPESPVSGEISGNYRTGHFPRNPPKIF